MDNPSFKILPYARTSQPWNVNNSSLGPKAPFAESLPVGSQETVARAVTFGNNGMIAYVVGTNSDTVYQYSLTDAYLLSGGVYTGRSLYVGDRESNPTSLEISSDGTKLFVLGTSSVALQQYTLATAWDVSTGTWTQNEFGRLNVGNQETVAKAITFNSDGTVAYLVGETNATVYQYTLSVPYKVGSGIYSGKSLYIGAQESTPSALELSSDGTKLFVLGRTSQALQQYTLSIAGDISTGTWTQSEFARLNVANQEATAKAITFNSDGTVAYLVGETNATVYQYTLSVPYKVGTGTYTGKSLYVGAQEATPSTLEFSPDGTKLFILGRTSLSLQQYTLATAWDVSTGTWTRNEFGRLNVGNQETVAKAVAFSSDGTKAYVVGETNATVYQYTLSVPYKVGSGTYSGKSLYVGAQELTPSALELSSDGTKLFVLGRTSQALQQYTLSTAWDVSTGVWTQSEFARLYVGTQETVARAVTFSSDGTKAYVIGSNTSTVYQYNLSAPFKIGSGVFSNKALYIGTQETVPVALEISSDGTKLFVLGTGSLALHQYTLSTPWDLATATWTRAEFGRLNVTNQETVAKSVTFSTDGLKAYVIGETNKTVYQYTLSVAFNLYNGVYASKSLYVGDREATPSAIELSSDGTKLFVIGRTGQTINQYTLGTAWDISTSTWNNSGLPSTNISGIVPGSRGLTFSTDGTMAYVTGTTSKTVYQFSLSVAFNIGSATYTNKTFYAGVTSQCYAVQFNSTGTKMYLLTNSPGAIHQYSLSTAWDVTTSSYDTVTFSLTSQDTSPTGFCISPDGTKFYITGTTNDRVYQYAMSTAWDLSTASYSSKSLAVVSQDSNMYSLQFNSDGTRLFLTGGDNFRFYQYNLTTGWDVSTGTYNSQFTYSGYYSSTTVYGIYLHGNAKRITFVTSNGYLREGAMGTASTVTTLGLLPTDPASWCFSLDGTKVYVTSYAYGGFGAVFYYTLSTSWDITTIGGNGTNFTIAGSNQGQAPNGIAVSSDGTKMYLLGVINDASYGQNRVFQYTLGTAWLPSTAAYAAAMPSLSLINNTYNSISTSPSCIKFDSTGKYMYIVFNNVDRVYSFRLGTAWAINTAYSTAMFPNTSAMTFSPDGTKFFQIDMTAYSGVGYITPYVLGTAWDITTIGGNTGALSLIASSYGQWPNGIAFSSDGTKMYLLGTINDSSYGQNRVFQFTLSTAWIPSSASYASLVTPSFTSINANYQSPSLSPGGLRFDSTGKTMYVVFNNLDFIYEFRLGTAWGVNTAYATTMNGNPTAMTFSPDGTRFYHVEFRGSTNVGTVFGYSLGTAWDITTIGGTGSALNLGGSSYGQLPNGIAFSSDGTKMYLLGTINDSSYGQNRVFQYTVGTPWSPSTASYASVVTPSFAVINATYQDASLSPSGLRFDSTGKTMYVVFNNRDQVYEFRLGTAWAANTSYGTNICLNPNGIFFSSDGTRMYHLDFTGFNNYGAVFGYSLSTAWDISTIGGTGQIYSLNSGYGSDPGGMTFSSDGTKMYLIGTINDPSYGYNRVYQFTLSTPWNPASASYSTVSNGLNQINSNYQSVSLSPSGLKFDTTGKRMYIVYNNRDQVYEFRLGTAWAVNTAYATTMFSTPSAMAFSPDGTKFYHLDMYGYLNGTVVNYSLGTAWDITTIGGTGQVYSTNGYGYQPNGLAFSSDGTKMYFLGTGNDPSYGYNRVYQFTLSTAWNVSTASYATITNTMNQINNIYGAVSTSPSGLKFDTTGKRMYIVYNNRDQVYEFRLGTAWAVNTAYSTTFFTSPSAIFFSPDGTKMYHADFYGWTNYGAIINYSMSTAWDISTIGGTGQVYSNSTYGLQPNGLGFSADGTKMYLLGTGNDPSYGYNKIYQYTLSTAWNIATNSYASKSFSIATLNATYADPSSSPSGIRFNADGTKVYYVTNNLDTIYASRLATAYDIATAVLPLSEATLNNVCFGDSGTKLYIVGTTNDTVYQFTLTTAYNVRTMKYAVKSFSVTTQETNPSGLAFSDDGTKMYVLGTTNKTVYQYTLSTAWDVSTATYATKSFSVNAQETSPNGLTFKPDGLAMFVVGASNNVLKYTLGVAWDVSTASFNAPLNGYVGYQEATATEHAFNPDGTRVYVIGSTNDTIYQYSLTSAWNLATMAYDIKSLSISARDGEPRGLAFKDDGTSMYLVGTTNDTVYQYTLSTAWDISTGTYATKSFSVTSQDTNPQSVQFGNSGANMYMIGSTNNTVYQYALSTAWDVSTASYSSISFSTLISGMTGTASGLFFSPDGTMMFVCFNDRKLVARYNLGTAWNVSTATFNNITCYVGDQETTPQSINFNSDGTILTVLGQTADQIFRYNLSTAWDLRTAALVNLGGASATADRYNVQVQGTNPWAVYLDTTGTKMLVLTTSNNTVFRYDLSIAWDIASATYSGKSYSVNFVETLPKALTFQPDGSTMFIAGRTLQAMVQFSM